MTVPNEECPDCGRRVLERGSMYAIEAALDRSGEPQAALLLDRMAAGKEREKDLVADMLMRFETFARTGNLLVPEQRNFLRGDLEEFKAGTLRVCFTLRPSAPCGQVRLTHGFVKRSQKTPRHEMDRGEAIIREDKAR